MYVNKKSAWSLQTLSPAWRVAAQEAWSAYAAGTVPVGAALADRRGVVVAKGRNRILDRAAYPQIGRTRLAHAEVNALLALSGIDLDPRTLAIFTTAEPCPLCIGAIVMANVREIRYAAREPYAGSIALLEATPYLRSKAIAVVPPQDRLFEGALKAIGVEFHLRVPGPRLAELVEACRIVRPDAVVSALRLHREGRWDDLRRMSAEDGLAEVVAALD